MIELLGEPVKKIIEEKIIEKIKNKNFYKNIIVLENTFDQSARTYAKSRKKMFEKYKIPYSTIQILESYDENTIIDIIKKLNADSNVAGIFLEMPLPHNINSKKIIDFIDYEKDVEGITTSSLGKLFAQDETISPPTALSIIRILEYYNIPISGNNVVILNRSLVIGKPLIALLLNRNATVTVCHTKTIDIDSHIERADIIVSGVAKPHFFNGKRLKKNVVIVDASINYENDRIIGDFDPDSFADRVDISYTPVPKGVGVVTNSILLENCVNLLLK